MSISAAQWSDSLLTHPDKTALPRLLIAGLIALLLNACTALSPDSSMPAGEYDPQVLTTLENWSLRGRLNIRNGDSSDTININWQQQQTNFEINLSGPLSLGAIRINGTPTGVTIEKAGEEPILASSIQDLSSDILGFSFPASSLLYWIKGIPSPGSRADINRTPEGFIATLSQADRQGQNWELQYDRYQNHGGYILPGRIRMEQSPYRLTFSINNWGVEPTTETEGWSD